MNKVQKDPRVVRIAATGYPFHGALSRTSPDPGENEIHVWTVHYRDLDRNDNTLSALTSRYERQLASRFKQTRDARNWILRRGYLRLVLGHYLCKDPARIHLITSDNGKPGLDIQCGSYPLSFSLSHTHEMVALAVARHCHIGIDIVKPDVRFPCPETADYLFSPGERAVIAGTPVDRQFHTFFRIWALKEALLKAQGGTAMMMKDTDVSEIVQEKGRNDWYLVRHQQKDHEFFIHESATGQGHYYAVAAASGI
jgi:4'-phosphopantetheinyl transferase